MHGHDQNRRTTALSQPLAMLLAGSLLVLCGLAHATTATARETPDAAPATTFMRINNTAQGQPDALQVAIATYVPASDGAPTS